MREKTPRKMSPRGSGFAQHGRVITYRVGIYKTLHGTYMSLLMGQRPSPLGGWFL